MADLEHPLERRAKLLAGKLSARKEMITTALAPKGKRPPFTEQLSKPDALAWWQKHRYDNLGQKVLRQMRANDIFELDAALMQAKENPIMSRFVTEK
jgi:hypothetical protein